MGSKSLRDEGRSDLWFIGSIVFMCGLGFTVIWGFENPFHSTVPTFSVLTFLQCQGRNAQA